MAMAEQNDTMANDRKCEGEITCPVCFEPLTEPVVFPCKHEECQNCFHQSLSTANFYCPICRQRISSWARRRVGNPVDSQRKRELELQRKDARDSPRLTKHRMIASDGELHEEYLKELRMVEKERKAEEELGRAEALRLTGFKSEQVEKDCQYAIALAKEIDQEERLRKEQEEIDRKYAERLDQSHSQLPTPSKMTKAKTVSSTKKKKTSDNQLPITIWFHK